MGGSGEMKELLRDVGDWIGSDWLSVWVNEDERKERRELG